MHGEAGVDGLEEAEVGGRGFVGNEVREDVEGGVQEELVFEGVAGGGGEEGDVEGVVLGSGVSGEDQAGKDRERVGVRSCR